MISTSTLTPDAPQARAASRAGFDAWWTLAIVFSLNLISYLNRQIIAMLVPDIKAIFAMTDFQVGILLGPAFSVFFALFAIPWGWASDRLSRRVVIASGALVFGLATAASGFAGGYVALLLARSLVAMGEASLGPASVSLISEKFPRTLLTTAISIYSTGLKLGGAAAFALGAVAIAAATSLVAAVPALHAVRPWRLVFAIAGAPAILLALLVLTCREPAKSARPAGAGADSSAWRFIVSERGLFIPLLIGFSLMTMCGQILIGWTPALIARRFGWTPAHYGPILAAIALASSLTLVFKGMVMDWLYARGVKDIHLRFYGWLLLASLPAVFGAFLVPQPGLFLALYAVVAVVAIPSISYLTVAVQMISPPTIRGRLAATIAIPLTLVGGLGPVLVGALTDFAFRDEAKLGYSMALVFSTMIPAALLCFRLCLRPLREAVRTAELRDGAKPA